VKKAADYLNEANAAVPKIDAKEGIAKHGGDTVFIDVRDSADIVLICAAGGQAALAGKTLVDMGYNKVSNVGGFGDWKDAGGPTES